MVLPRPAPALLLALGLPLASAGCAVQQPATAERAYHASMAPLVDRNLAIITFFCLLLRRVFWPVLH